MKYDTVPNYSPEAQSRMPHAWTSGTQVQLLQSGYEYEKRPGICDVTSAKPISLPANMSGYHDCPSIQAEQSNWQDHSGSKAKFSKMGLFTAGWKNITQA